MTITKTHPAQFYDLNIWGSDEGELRLSAYEWTASDGDYIETNYDKFYTLQLNAPKHIKEIEFLLNDLYLNQYPLTDYDAWIGLDEVLNGDTPETIKLWLNSLPDYRIPTIRMFEGE